MSDSLDGSDIEKLGWQRIPLGRGTLDILWSCAITLFLCSWEVLCLNVPSPKDSQSRIFLRKFLNTGLFLLAPEATLIFALGERQSAIESVAMFRDSGYQDWTMTHAFYANMGGFVLQSPDYDPFPVDAKQLHYLISKGYVAFPKISKKTIVDKNKTDGLLRIVTLFQTFWFLFAIIARAAQGLVITLLELTTGAFVICTVVTTFCWVHKPSDVTSSETLKTNVPIDQILFDAGQAVPPSYQLTPFDFLHNKRQTWLLIWKNWLNFMRHLGLNFGRTLKPTDRFANTECVDLEGWSYFFLIIVSTMYTATLFLGWNFDFPTRTEQTLWRIASIMLLANIPLCNLVTEYAFDWHYWIRKKLSSRSRPDEIIGIEEKTSQSRIFEPVNRIIRRVADAFRNNSFNKDPSLTVPLKAILPMYIVGTMYVFARTYVFVADIIELRSLPASAYDTVDLSSILPHL